jgi:F0F1-type ATP synthase membrane subunit c/vacuolar-type H+-ATPase subunit K
MLGRGADINARLPAWWLSSPPRPVPAHAPGVWQAFAVEPVQPNDDPGWPRGSALFILFPPAARLQSRRSADGLLILRQLFLAFVSAILLFGFVQVFVVTESGPVLPWLAILGGVMIVSLVLTRAVNPALDCTSSEKLAASYRTRFFIRLAFTENVALFAFMFGFAGGPRWIYAVGGAFTLWRFWAIVAPTRAALARDQEELNAQGCGLSVVAALRGSMPRS